MCNVTDDKNDFECYLSLLIYLGELHPDEVSKALSLAPTTRNVLGEKKTNSLGRVREIKRMGWFLESEEFVHDKSSAAHLDWLLSKLTPAKIGLLSLQKMGDMDMHISCMQRPKSVVAKFEFFSNQLAMLADLNLELDIGVGFENLENCNNMRLSKTQVKAQHGILIDKSYVHLHIDFLDSNLQSIMSLKELFDSKNLASMMILKNHYLEISTLNCVGSNELPQHIEWLAKTLEPFKMQWNNLKNQKNIEISLVIQWDSSKSGLTLTPDQLRILANLSHGILIETFFWRD